MRFYIWEYSPVIRVLFPYVLGLLLAHQFPNLKLEFKLIAILGFLLLFLSSFFYFLQKNRVLAGIPLYLAFLLLGYFQLKHSIEKHSAKHYSHHLANTDFFHVEITDKPEPKAKTDLVRVKVIRGINDQESFPLVGKLLLYVKFDSLQFGDHLLIENKLMPISGTNTPGAFNYSEFMAEKGFYHQALLKNKEIQVISKNTSQNLTTYLIAFQGYCKQQLQEHIESPDARAVASALLLGDKDLIEEDLRNAYAASGAMHVLAVSGLHVGVFYLILVFFFSALDEKVLP